MEDQTAISLQWLLDFHTTGDSLNAKMWVTRFYTEDCELYFSGQPVVKGHDAIIALFEQQFALLESMQHEIHHFDVLPDRIYQEASISYIVKGDPEKRTVKLLGLAVFGKALGEDKMRFFRVYLDPTPLRERIQAVISLGGAANQRP